MNLRHSALAAAAVTVAVPVGLLAVGAGSSLAHQAVRADAHAASAPTVALRSTKYGKILVVGKTGRTLYLFTGDSRNKSNCTGRCASAWPPLLTKGKPTGGAGISARKLGEIKSGSSHQVTYNGHPLYTFVSDTGAGSITGEASGGFYVVSAGGNEGK